MIAVPPDRLSNRQTGVAMMHIPARKMCCTDPDQTPARTYEGRPKDNFVKKAQISTYRHIIYLKYFEKKPNWFFKKLAWTGGPARKQQQVPKVKEYKNGTNNIK